MSDKDKGMRGVEEGFKTQPWNPNFLSGSSGSGAVDALFFFSRLFLMFFFLSLLFFLTFSFFFLKNLCAINYKVWVITFFF